MPFWQFLFNNVKWDSWLNLHFQMRWDDRSFVCLLFWLKPGSRNSTITNPCATKEQQTEIAECCCWRIFLQRIQDSGWRQRLPTTADTYFFKGFGKIIRHHYVRGVTAMTSEIADNWWHTLLPVQLLRKVLCQQTSPVFISPWLGWCGAVAIYVTDIL